MTSYYKLIKIKIYKTQVKSLTVFISVCKNIFKMYW